MAQTPVKIGNHSKDNGPLFIIGMRREARALPSGVRVVIDVRELEASLSPAPSAIISFGLCGALDPALRPGDLAVGTEVRFGGEVFAADAAWVAALTSAFPEARVGPFAGSDRIVATRTDKASLAAATDAIAVDMESHAVARCAKQHGIPFAVLRVVSDGALDTLPGAAQAGFRPDGRIDVVAVLRALAKRPRELPALIRTGRDASVAFKALDQAARALGGMAG